jgi:hypothetical protein
LERAYQSDTDCSGKYAAQKLMKIFMKEKKSIAVVVDEFGGTAELLRWKILWKKFSERLRMSTILTIT